MSSRIIKCLSFLVVLAVAVPALAGEGRTPIWQPTTIASPGKYIVTRNLSSAVGPVIDIQADDVDVDLNGFRLGGGPVATIQAIGHNNVTLRNGTIVGGLNGILIDGSPDPTAGVRKVVIEDVKVLDTTSVGVLLIAVRDFALRRNNVAGVGGECIYVDGGILVDLPVEGTIEDNIVEECAATAGIRVNNGSSVGIINNRVERLNLSPDLGPAHGGIVYDVSEGGLIAENTVQDVRNSYGIYLGDTDGCKLHNNVVRLTGFDGIYIAGFSDDNLILSNVVTRAGSDGLTVEGNRNHIDRNVLNENGWATGLGHGFHIYPAFLGNDNTLGRNTARGNPGGPCLAPPGPQNTPDFCDEGFNNSSFGDNFLPNAY